MTIHGGTENEFLKIVFHTVLEFTKTEYAMARYGSGKPVNTSATDKINIKCDYFDQSSVEETLFSIISLQTILLAIGQENLEINFTRKQKNFFE